jgi:hypothetical protein
MIYLLEDTIIYNYSVNKLFILPRVKQFSIKMERSGIEPEIAICKIDVLPIKLYPLSPDVSVLLYMVQ